MTCFIFSFMTEDTLTARELAEHLAVGRSAADRAFAMRRVQYWTAEELIDPVHIRYTGRGTVRRYPRWCLLEAAILWELSERNIGIEQMRYIWAAMRFDHNDREQHPFRAALKGRRRVLLLIDLAQTKPPKTIEIARGRPFVLEAWPVGLWLDLTAIFQRLRVHFAEHA